MATKKTIQINPELFKISGTKKNREKKELTLAPIINPNSLKNKLLNRIKEHKNQEIKQSKKSDNPAISSKLSHKNSNKNNSNNSDNNLEDDPNKKNYTDEFYGALDYLSDLTKKQKTTETKKKGVLNKTLKNVHSATTSPIDVCLDLPAELQEPVENNLGIINDIYQMNYKNVNDVPYGCLKGGKKQTYREWKQQVGLNESIKDTPDIIRPPTPPKKSLPVFLEGAYETPTIDSTNSQSREERLEQIKNKLKKIQDKETTAKQESLEKFNKLERQLTNPFDSIEMDKDIFNDDDDIEKLIKEREKKSKDAPKKYLKKTTKQKFTLGKSNNLRRVSVLIKNRQTRKNVIETQKELKKTDLTDVRKYLRQHGMIKVGSTCPADILRKTFEAAVLTGDVNNTNKDTLLHNFLSGVDKEK